MASVAPRLKELRKRAQPPVTIRDIAAKLDMPYSSYAGYEDEKKYKKPILPFDFAKRVAAVLEPHGIGKSEVMRLAGLDSDYVEAEPAPTKETLIVSASVAAGVWREHVEWPPEERYPLEVGPSPVPKAERFAVRMEGYSMDRTIPPGSDLECLRVQFGAVEPQPGDLVIVERQVHDLTEMTCKRLDIEDGEWVLRGESSKPEFETPIRLGRPDKGVFVDNEVRVVGIVIKAHQNHFRRRA